MGQRSQVSEVGRRSGHLMLTPSGTVMQEPHLKGPWHLTGNAAQAGACRLSSTLRVHAQDTI